MEVIDTKVAMPFLFSRFNGELRRFGRQEDGGYVVPNLIIGEITTVITCGVSIDWSFEKSLKKFSPEVEIFAYDHTLSKITFAKAFLKLFNLKNKQANIFKDLFSVIGLFIDYRNFFSRYAKHEQKRLTNRKHMSFDITLAEIYDSIKDNNTLLKIDIEGDEYRLIEDICFLSERIKLLIIEFHGTDPLRSTFVKAMSSLRLSFEIAHVHPNNNSGIAKDGLPDVLEITFINRNFYPDMTSVVKSSYIPGLDFPNNPKFPEITLIYSI